MKYPHDENSTNHFYSKKKKCCFSSFLKAKAVILAESEIYDYPYLSSKNLSLLLFCPRLQCEPL